MRPKTGIIAKAIKRDLLILLGVGVLVRLATAWPQQQPNYFDAAYSYVNALNLAAGRGFVEDFVWNYLGEPGLPPQPSHLYWMPLTSILAWLGIAAGGMTYRAAQGPFIILSALLGPISYGSAYILSGRRRPSWLAGLFGIFSGFYFPFWTAIDNFTPFGVAGSLALLAAWRGMGDRGWMIEDRGWKRGMAAIRVGAGFFPVLAGGLVGLAHLARADGPLLLVAIVLVLWFRDRTRNQEANVQPDLPAKASTPVYRPAKVSPPFTFYVSQRAYLVCFTFYLLLGYLLVITPWFWRNWQATGTILPVNGSQTIWLRDYDELFSYGRELSARSFLAQGMAAIVKGRWWALSNNLQTVLAPWGMIFLAPLAVAGGWHLRRRLLVQLAGWYAFLLFITMSLIFAFPGVRGGLFHSGAAVLPFIYGLAVVGLDVTVDWVAARRRQWKAEEARWVFGIGLVVMAVALSGFIYYQRVVRHNAWNTADGLYPAIATWVARQNPEATVMIGNPPAYRYHGGGLSVVIPNEDLETTLEVAAYYQVDYLVLDRNHPAPLADLYQRPTEQPALALVQTFGQGDRIYVFKIEQEN